MRGAGSRERGGAALRAATARRLVRRRVGARQRSCASSSASARSAPALSIGRLPLPHFGECTQAGQPLLARAVAHALERRLEQRLDAVEEARREADAARRAVVEEDRGAADLRVCASVVMPPTSWRSQSAKQREQRERGVLDRVQRRPSGGARARAARRDLVGDLEPDAGRLDRGTAAARAARCRAAPGRARGGARSPVMRVVTRRRPAHQPEVPGRARRVARQDLGLLLRERAREPRARRRRARARCCSSRSSSVTRYCAPRCR